MFLAHKVRNAARSFTRKTRIKLLLVLGFASIFFIAAPRVLHYDQTPVGPDAAHADAPDCGDCGCGAPDCASDCGSCACGK